VKFAQSFNFASRKKDIADFSGHPRLEPRWRTPDLLPCVAGSSPEEFMRRILFPLSQLNVMLALLLALALPIFSQSSKEKDPDEIGDRNVSGKVNFYSLEKEIALGKQLAQQVERQSKLINEAVVAEYVNRIGQNLVRNSDAKVPFTIKVLEDPQVNAFALPGGFFFVNSGLILKADTEAELAGVMAHEIAHVAARHGTRQATKAQIAQLATIPLIFMGGLRRTEFTRRRDSWFRCPFSNFRETMKPRRII
jgi:Peptidase family M48